MPKWNDEGEHRMLDILFGAQAVDANVYLGLYKDAEEPGESDGISEITEVTVANGYARIALARGTWDVTADLASYAEQTYTASGGDWEDVTGAFLTEGASGDTLLLAVQHFAAARTINDGDSLKVTPKVRGA